ncbi:pseudaminic acid synthase [Eilatimonas milleporae]|uniref:N-acetylneuraminate synthase n=1 Tax=Eilatimonas milleporae TaxID=911205 RepID=A0A3M0CJB4_9PROT|nr:pseudaminic acid synthase [Eilatimonas milleporae]RMB08965.1 N-acetylneuraminate synthase [Eilatimonas milleporae]
MRERIFSSRFLSDPSMPPVVVAEVSGNHGGSLDKALALIDAAAAAGADAVKFQTYEPQTITLDHDGPAFRVGGLWHGERLYDLYARAQTPFEWHTRLFEHARERGIAVFSAPFDPTAVDLLETLRTPAYKIASCELVDTGLIRHVARTGKPVILSTGMASREEISEALDVIKALRGGLEDISLLHCISGYPTPVHNANLRRMIDMATRFNVPVGLSDHSPGLAVPLAAVALGAVLIEKHVCLSRDDDGAVDGPFSLEPDELMALVRQSREVWQALGDAVYGPTETEADSLRFRRSLYFVRDLTEGAAVDSASVRSVRPSGGLHPRHLAEIMGRQIRRPVRAGTPVTWEHLV